MSDHAFAFASQNTFLKVAAGDVTRPYAVAGIPWDGAVTNRPGARFGPDAIRRASHKLCDGIHPHFNATPVGHLTDLGDLALPNTGTETMRAAMMPLLPPILAAQHVCWLGGDHSIKLPLLRAFRAHCGRPLALIHLDANCDTWEDHFGEPSGHGTWTFEALQEGLIVPEATIQIGIRSSGTKAAREYVNAAGSLLLANYAVKRAPRSCLICLMTSAGASPPPAIPLSISRSILIASIPPSRPVQARRNQAA